jgi:hypothetical protein
MSQPSCRSRRCAFDELVRGAVVDQLLIEETVEAFTVG